MSEKEQDRLQQLGESEMEMIQTAVSVAVMAPIVGPLAEYELYHRPISSFKRKYVTGEITLEEFENRVGRALEARCSR